MNDLIKREDAIKVVHEYFIEAFYKEPTKIDEDGDKVFADMRSVNKLLTHNKTISKALKELPLDEAEDRHYIKIYADDEPSVKAEKLYQICGETQNREVAEWLKEYFPSNDDNWIPVSERLPSESDNYLCTIPLDADETYTEVLTFHKGRFYEDDDEWGATYHDDVIAWIPLPKPYKESEA